MEVLITYSLVVPVYRNEDSISELLSVCNEIDGALDNKFEVIFVIDGSPDNSLKVLFERLPGKSFEWQLVNLSRNFGSFAAIREGFSVARGKYVAVMAADLQEPPGLILKFFEVLANNEADIVVGSRGKRDDPLSVKLPSALFWWFYRKFIIPELPAGGVDVFACNGLFRSKLLSLEEKHSSLIGQLFWLGFRRRTIVYDRLKRRHGASGWSLRRKVNYLFDSIFSFSDLPIRLLVSFGFIAVILSIFLGFVVLFVKFFHGISVPGYAATMIAISFFGGLNAFGLGVIGGYIWRTYENTKGRPLAVTMSHCLKPDNFGTVADIIVVNDGKVGK